MLLKRTLPAALGLWIGVTQGMAQAQEGSSLPPTVAPALPAPALLAIVPPDAAIVAPDPTSNQRMADTIAQRLRASGQMRGYRVDIRFADGVAELTGHVGDGAQRDMVLGLVQAVPGVERVHDLLTVGGAVVTAQGMAIQVPDVNPLGSPERPSAAEGAPGSVTSNSGPAASLAVNSGAQEPMSIMTGFNPGMPAGGQPPPMPPYAWPTFAPYNNYSRVAYPTILPHEAFPFIGPQYPFPKIPLGWRSVSLTWQDGHWWYGREACGHDWWRIRYN